MFILRSIIKSKTTKAVQNQYLSKSQIREHVDHKMPESPKKQSKSLLKFERLSANAYPPTRGSKFAAGYDLYAAYDYVIPKMGKELVRFLFYLLLNLIEMNVFLKNR